MPAINMVSSSGFGQAPMRGRARFRSGAPRLPTNFQPSTAGTNNANVSGPMPPPNPMLSHQGGMSSTRLSAPAGAAGVLPGFDDGGAVDGFNGVANDDSPDAFDAIDQVIQYGRQKHGLADQWRRSDNVEDDRDKQMGGAEQFARSSLQSLARGVGDTLGYGRLPDQSESATATIPNGARGDTGVVAIPGTMQDEAGLNDVGTNYKDGGPVEEDDETEAIPSRPAGPGGDKPDTNPFPVKHPSPPFGKRYADGGAIDDADDDGDSTGAIPDDGDGDDSPSQASEGQGAPEAMGGAPNPQKLVSYLMGADAAPPQLVDAIERSIDPQGRLDPDTRHTMAIAQAAKQGGPEAAWGVLQHYRKKYDASKAFAAAALNGVAGKPPDIAAAAQAATKAYTYMPDGTQVQFVPGANGVTATVKRVGSNAPMGNVNLTPEQFHDFVRGKSGQFDNVLENGPQVLAELQRSPGRPFGEGAQSMVGGQQQAPQQSQRPPQDQPPGVIDASGTQGDPEAEARRQAFYAAPDRNAQWDPKLRARAIQMFPDDRQKQYAWMAEQEQKGEENQTARTRAERPWEVPKAQATQAGRANVANIYTQSRERMAEANNITKADIANANRLANSADRRVASDARLVASANNSPTPLDPDSDTGKAILAAAQRLRRYQYGNSGGAQSPQQRAPAQQGGPPAGHPGAKQDPQGKWREKGPDGLWHLIQ